MKKYYLVLLCATLLLTGCPMGMLVPHSRGYQPSNLTEAELLDKAEKNIFPDDVRADITKYDTTLIVWTGIIKEVEEYRNNDTNLLSLKIEHHYYDWIEDFGLQPEKIFLSPKGEGIFKSRHEYITEDQLNEAKKRIVPGNMIIMYGIPKELDDDVIIFESQGFRMIEKKWYSTSYLNYGRPGEPVK